MEDEENEVPMFRLQQMDFRRKLDPYERMLRGKMIGIAAAHYTKKDVEEVIDTEELYSAAEKNGRIKRCEEPQVLLVMKNRFKAAGLAVMMQKFGAKVFICTNGKDAYLKYLRLYSARFNLAIVQWDLDDVGGRDLAFYERQKKGNLGFLAALPPGMLASDAIRSGADLFLREPLCVHMHTIRDLLIPNAQLSYLYPTQLMATAANHDSMRTVLDQVATTRDHDADNIIADAMMDFDGEQEMDLAGGSQLLTGLIDYLQRNQGRTGSGGANSEEYRMLGKAFKASLGTFNQMKNEMVEMTNEMRKLRDFKRKNQYLLGAVDAASLGQDASKKRGEFNPFEHLDVDAMSKKEISGIIKKFRREIHNAQVENDCLVRELERLAYFKVQVEEDLVGHNVTVKFEEANVVVDPQESQNKYNYNMDVTKHAAPTVAKAFDEPSEPAEARVQEDTETRQARAKSLAAKSILALKQHVTMAQLRDRANRHPTRKKSKTVMDLIRNFEMAAMEKEDVFLQEERAKHEKLDVKVVTPIPISLFSHVEDKTPLAHLHNHAVDVMKGICTETNMLFARLMASHPVLHSKLEDFSHHLRQVAQVAELKTAYGSATNYVEQIQDQMRQEHDKDIKMIKDIAKAREAQNSTQSGKSSVAMKMELVQMQMKFVKALPTQQEGVLRRTYFNKWMLFSVTRQMTHNNEAVQRKVRREVFETKHGVVDRLQKQNNLLESRLFLLEEEVEAKTRLTKLQEETNKKTEGLLASLKEMYQTKQKEVEDLQDQLKEVQAQKQQLINSRRNTMKKTATPREGYLRSPSVSSTAADQTLELESGPSESMRLDAPSTSGVFEYNDDMSASASAAMSPQTQKSMPKEKMPPPLRSLDSFTSEASVPSSTKTKSTKAVRKVTKASPPRSVTKKPASKRDGSKPAESAFELSMSQSQSKTVTERAQPTTLSSPTMPNSATMSASSLVPEHKAERGAESLSVSQASEQSAPTSVVLTLEPPAVEKEEPIPHDQPLSHPEESPQVVSEPSFYAPSEDDDEEEEEEEEEEEQEQEQSRPTEPQRLAVRDSEEKDDSHIPEDEDAARSFTPATAPVASSESPSVPQVKNDSESKERAAESVAIIRRKTKASLEDELAYSPSDTEEDMPADDNFVGELPERDDEEADSIPSGNKKQPKRKEKKTKAKKAASPGADPIETSDASGNESMKRGAKKVVKRRKSVTKKPAQKMEESVPESDAEESFAPQHTEDPESNPPSSLKGPASKTKKKVRISVVEDTVELPPDVSQSRSPDGKSLSPRSESEPQSESFTTDHPEGVEFDAPKKPKLKQKKQVARKKLRNSSCGSNEPIDITPSAASVEPNNVQTATTGVDAMTPDIPEPERENLSHDDVQKSGATSEEKPSVEVKHVHHYYPAPKKAPTSSVETQTTIPFVGATQYQPPPMPDRKKSTALEEYLAELKEEQEQKENESRRAQPQHAEKTSVRVSSPLEDSSAPCEASLSEEEVVMETSGNEEVKRSTAKKRVAGKSSRNTRARSKSTSDSESRHSAKSKAVTSRRGSIANTQSSASKPAVQASPASQTLQRKSSVSRKKTHKTPESSHISDQVASIIKKEKKRNERSSERSPAPPTREERSEVDTQGSVVMNADSVTNEDLEQPGMTPLEAGCETAESTTSPIESSLAPKVVGCEPTQLRDAHAVIAAVANELDTRPRSAPPLGQERRFVRKILMDSRPMETLQTQGEPQSPPTPSPPKARGSPQQTRARTIIPPEEISHSQTLISKKSSRRFSKAAPPPVSELSAIAEDGSRVAIVSTVNRNGTSPTRHAVSRVMPHPTSEFAAFLEENPPGQLPPSTISATASFDDHYDAVVRGGNVIVADEKILTEEHVGGEETLQHQDLSPRVTEADSEPDLDCESSAMDSKPGTADRPVRPQKMHTLHVERKRVPLQQQGPHSTMAAINHSVAPKTETTYSAVTETPKIFSELASEVQLRASKQKLSPKHGLSPQSSPTLASLQITGGKGVESVAGSNNQTFRLETDNTLDDVAANEAAMREMIAKRKEIRDREERLKRRLNDAVVAAPLNVLQLADQQKPQTATAQPWTSTVEPARPTQQLSPKTVRPIRQTANVVFGEPSQSTVGNSVLAPVASAVQPAPQQVQQKFKSISEANRMLGSFQKAARRLRDACGLQLSFSFGNNNPDVLDVVKEVQRALFNAIVVAEEERARSRTRRDPRDTIEMLESQYKLADSANDNDFGELQSAVPVKHETPQSPTKDSVPRRPQINNIVLSEVVPTSSVQQDRNLIISSQLQQPSNVKLLLLRQQQEALKERQRKADGLVPKRPPVYQQPRTQRLLSPESPRFAQSAMHLNLQMAPQGGSQSARGHASRSTDEKAPSTSRVVSRQNMELFQPYQHRGARPTDQGGSKPKSRQ